MRADRLLSLLLILQTEGKVKAEELARRLEVSRRTIYRDLDALTAAGVPVYGAPGPSGGVALLGDYRTQLTGLSEAEARALFVGTPRALLHDLGLSRTAEAALVKLTAALPERQRPDARHARQRLHVDTTGWQEHRDAVPHLLTLQEAVWQERKLRFVYARGDGRIVERLADPLGLVARGSTWYLVAASEGEARTYRISRVQSAEVTDEPCRRPDGFDLVRYWETSKVAFKAALPRYPAKVRAAPGLVKRMRTSGRYARVLSVEPCDPLDARGWLTLEILFEVAWEACEYLLSFGPEVEVIEPLALRKRVAEAAKATTKLYSH